MRWPLRRRRRSSAGVELGNARPVLERLLEGILSFWDERVIDPDGGYALGHDAAGHPTRAVARHVVSQARTVWFFARLARSPYGEDRHAAWAAHGLEFLRLRMWDPEFGGFFWEVGPEGPRDPRKHLYGQAFGLFALAQDDSRSEGVELFELVRRKAHDERHGGYVESFARDWSPLAPDEPSQIGPPSRYKTANTHLHLLEAFCELALLQPSSDAVLGALRELVGLMSGVVVDGRAGTCIEVFDPDWAPRRGYRSSYGHDVENVWLLMRACRALGSSDEQLLAPVYRPLWDHALRYGFDGARGGLFEAGPPRRRADRRDKLWWVQAEGLLSALALWQRTGDERYRRAFELTLGWVASAQADWDGGDWHAVIDRRGRPSGAKSGAWKDPYHQGRAVLECLELLDGDAGGGARR